MKTLIITIFIFILSGPVFAYDEDTLRCNPTNGQWAYEDSESVLKPNPATGQWTYEDSESTLRPNPATGQWEYAQ